MKTHKLPFNSANDKEAEMTRVLNEAKKVSRGLSTVKSISNFFSSPLFIVLSS